MVKKFEQLFPYILIGFILAIILFAISNCDGKVVKEYVYKTKTKIDTVIVEGKKPDPIIINKKVYIHRIDTLYLDKNDIIINPFSVCLDTTTKDNDTMSVCFSYPDQMFNYALKKAPPKIQIITITKDNYVEPSDWNKLLLFVAGATTMYVSYKIANY